MGKSAKTPKAPDYTALAEQETASKRSTQSNPWGQQSWSADPNSPSGYRVDSTLNPMDQMNLDTQRGLNSQLMGTAGGLLGKYGSGNSQTAQAGMAGHQTRGALPALGDPEFGAVQEVQDAMMSRMVPDMERARQQQEARLVAQGVGGNTGGEAWDRMQTEVGRNENDQRQQALLGAMGAYQDIFNRKLANRGQIAGEQDVVMGLNNQVNIANAGNRTSTSQYNRGADFNELMGILSGVQPVGMPAFMNDQGTAYGAAGQQQYGSAMDAANAKNAAKSGMWGTIGGVAGSIFGGPIGGAIGSAIGSKF